MCSGRGDGQLRPPGFPVRKSPDHSLVAGSSGLIAGSNVLHRLLMPRHPPCALINLATTYRCSRPLCSSQDTGGPATKPRRIRGEVSRSFRGCLTARSLRTQQRARPAPRRHRRSGPREEDRTRPALPGRQPNNQMSTDEQPSRDIRPGHGSGRGPRTGTRQVLLRKEVIQPHLPVRLPCYDFVPIADPTFDGSLPDGLGHRLRVLPTFVT